MKFKLGDILVWRSTSFIDLVLENVFFLKGLHSGIILVGSKFTPLAVRPSPSHTYVTVFVDKLFPVEDIICDFWDRPNASSLHLITRTTGPSVSEDRAYDILVRYLSFRKLPKGYTGYLAVAAYFRYGTILPGPLYHDYSGTYRYALCPSMIGYLLYHFGYLTTDAHINNLLPIDFLDLCFYQCERYDRIELFDKGTSSSSWLFSILFHRFRYVRYIPIRSAFIEEYLQEFQQHQ